MAEQSSLRFSQPCQRILASFQHEDEYGVEDSANRIHVSDTVSRIASAYEKFRNIIDYKEEHLLRKNAIHRILRRRMLGGGTGASIARPLIIELIQARYIPNDRVPETKVVDVRGIINRYLALNHYAGADLPHWQDRDRQQRWLTGLAAVEIEQALATHNRDQAMAEAMYEVMVNDLALAGTDSMDKRERDLQIFLAIQRALLKADEVMVSYALFRLYVPDWSTVDEAGAQRIAAGFAEVRAEIDAQQYHKIGDFLMRTMRRYAAFFWIMRDVAEENPSAAVATFANPELLVEGIRRAAARRYADARVRLRRSVIRSFIFIFMTKMLLAFAVEVPFELVIRGAIDRRTLGINILFHPVLMFLIAATIRVPSKKNTEKLIQGISDIAYRDTGRQLVKRARIPRQRNAVMRGIVVFVYSATFLITFGLIVNLLRYLHFNVVSGALFLFFLSIISFFAVRIRISAREYVVLEQREGPFGFLIDFFTLPILRVGRWISLRAPKVNIVLFILDFFIEAPFKSFLAVLEELTSFLREKREEIT